MNSKKAKNILKWNNSISLDQGLNNTIKWYVKNFNKIKNLMKIIFIKYEKH